MAAGPPVDLRVLVQVPGARPGPPEHEGQRRLFLGGRWESRRYPFCAPHRLIRPCQGVPVVVFICQPIQGDSSVQGLYFVN